jgi:transposase-like protein
MGRKLVMGSNGQPIKCPQCGSTNIKVTAKWFNFSRNNHEMGRCKDCGAKWEVLGTK